MLLGGVCLCASGADDDRIKVDNEYIRVIKAVQQLHLKTALHKHDANRVMIYVDGGDLDVTSPEGKVTHEHWKPEQVVWAPITGMHTSENVGKGPIRIYEIELKKPGPSTAAKRDPKLDPVKIDPKHNVLAFENDQVRVFRSWREAGKSEMMHEHTGAGRVVVLLTDIDASVKSGDGSTSEMKLGAGEVRWTAGASTHAGTNKGAKRFDMILVEVK